MVTCTVCIPHVRRRYRLAMDGDSAARLVSSKPSGNGSVSLSVARYDAHDVALNACLAKLLRDFDADLPAALDAFQKSYSDWVSGRPGMRPRSRAARIHAERLGNDLFALIRGYAVAYTQLTTHARERSMIVHDHHLSPWIASGIHDVAAGKTGWYTLEEMLNQKGMDAATGE